ncbi:hypothetical protein SESBI_25557 [Sesbania bispinosa]|nr:hypothetical protein SESBI_25557 [Sesbania bispinosa]
MEYTEDINEWQQIEKHPFPETSEWNMVVINENYLEVQSEQSSSSIHHPPSSSTPTHHEASSLSPQQILPTTMDPEDGPSSPSATSSSASNNEGETPTPEAAPPSDWRLRVANEGKKLLKMRFEAMRAEVLRVASKVCNCAMWSGAFWSITHVAGAAAAVVLVSLVYVGIRRRRRRVGRGNALDHHSVYLVKEKDEVSIVFLLVDIKIT